MWRPRSQHSIQSRGEKKTRCLFSSFPKPVLFFFFFFFFLFFFLRLIETDASFLNQLLLLLQVGHQRQGGGGGLLEIHVGWVLLFITKPYLPRYHIVYYLFYGNHRSIDTFSFFLFICLSCLDTLAKAHGIFSKPSFFYSPVNLGPKFSKCTTSGSIGFYFSKRGSTGCLLSSLVPYSKQAFNSPDCFDLNSA